MWAGVDKVIGQVGSLPLFNRVGLFFQSPTTVLGTVFYSGWFAINARGFNQAVEQQGRIETSKVGQIWSARREVILAALSLMAAGSMLTSWFIQIGVVSLGSWVQIIGYGSGGIRSAFSLWDAFLECEKKLNRSSLSLPFLSKMGLLLKVAFAASLVAWGALGIAKVLSSSAVICLSFDLVLLLAVALFCGQIGLSFYLPQEGEEIVSPERESSPLLVK